MGPRLFELFATVKRLRKTSTTSTLKSIGSRHGASAAKAVNPLGTLCAFARADCADPKDRLFALVSLWTDWPFEVRYERSLEKIYIDFSEAIVRTPDRPAGIMVLSPNSIVVPDTQLWVPQLLYIAAYQSRFWTIVARPEPPSSTPDWRQGIPSELLPKRVMGSTPAPCPSLMEKGLTITLHCFSTIRYEGNDEDILGAKVFDGDDAESVVLETHGDTKTRLQKLKVDSWAAEFASVPRPKDGNSAREGSLMSPRHVGLYVPGTFTDQPQQGRYFEDQYFAVVLRLDTLRKPTFHLAGLCPLSLFYADLSHEQAFAVPKRVIVY